MPTSNISRDGIRHQVVRVLDEFVVCGGILPGEFSQMIDRLLALLSESDTPPDYQRLAAEELGIRGASPALARRLIEEALLVTDWRERWMRVGSRAVADAPAVPGVYVFRDSAGRPLYVGKAAHLRRRLRAHFGDCRWLSLPPSLARVATVECEPLGSELEAILREAALIRDLRPEVNVQTGSPLLETRAIPRVLVRDVVLLLPSIAPQAAELVGARANGATLVHHTVLTDASVRDAAAAMWDFIGGDAATDGDGRAPLVFSWLAGRGRPTTRFIPTSVRPAPHSPPNSCAC